MKMPKHVFPHRVILAIIIFALITAAGHTQVNREELENLPPVTFLNYEGPHAQIDTREEIRQIGVVLGLQIAARERGVEPTLAAMTIEQRRAYSYLFQTGGLNRYFVIHSISEDENGKLDADIFGLGVDVGVDHVRNLRTIIQGYLQAAYNYSERDAALLAEFITVYNAVYRGYWDYFLLRYKTQVISYLERDKAGLSIRYDEWPGRTLMLIPLGIGGLSSIDTSAITDQRVIDELRRDDGMGISQRQDMVDLMEREAQEAEQRAQIEREAIREEERRIAEERQEIAEERQRTQEDRQTGTITQQQAQQQQQELDRREQAVEQREQAVVQRIEEVEKIEEFAEQKTDEAQQAREEIARDQQTAINQETARDQQAAVITRDDLSTVVQETAGGVFGATIERINPPMGRLIRFNPSTGAEIRRSPLDTVHIRTVTFIGGKIIAIAGEARGQGAVRLIEINQTTLEMARQGNDDIRTGSLLWVSGNDLYAITTNINTNECFIGRFDLNLALQAKSAVKVHPEASVAITQGRLLTQREDGSVLLLNPADLTEIRN